MKKKGIWIAAAVVVIAVLLVILIPRPLLGKDAAVTSVYYKTEDITEQIDTEKLIGILADAKTAFSLRAVSAYWTEEYPFEINLMSRGTSLHIVMGKSHYVYDRHLHLARTIIGGEELYTEIFRMITQK